MKTKIYILLLIIAAGISKSPMVFAEGKPLTDLNVITYSQGKWGGQKSQELKMIFDRYFPDGLIIGTENKIVFTDPSEIEKFLPSGMSSKPLPFGQMTNPGTVYKNALAGEAVTLALNLALDHYRREGMVSLSELVIREGEMKGKTVAELFREANQKLGGGYSVYSFDILTDALYAVNRNFNDQGIDKGFLGNTFDLEIVRASANNK
ncbi:MAG: hypothetical protein BWY67_01232 [Bacteroidetes bacterium ADurb.Bin397]|jgi:hypothetical protein|nr:MAG: hypothetical protein BWY67_01232 [Bacteroidetes bacterium ADurb.Bin397]